jgi:ABC-2 type transport system permease protein
MNIKPHNSTFWSRLVALTRKEARQLWRDPSSMALGIALPVVLILIFGYGLSLDVKNARVAVVMEDHSPVASDVHSGLRLSPYLTQVDALSMNDAESLLREHQVDAILRVPSDFSRLLAAGRGSMQLVLLGTDATTARVVEGYITGAMAQWSARQADSAANLNGNRFSITPVFGTVSVEHRLWFNAANTSSWYLVPGLIVLIMTTVGAFLMALVVAREWERGTLESLFVTPVRPLEILIAKMIPNFVVGMIGFAMCLLASHFLFHVPIMGSVTLLIIVSVLYMMVAQGLGLLISSATKNQFVASQTALVTSFFPAVMLSGFLFDLNNVPVPVYILGEALPATHFLELIKTLLLAGNVWSIIIVDSLLLVAYATALLVAARLVTNKRLA